VASTWSFVRDQLPSAPCAVLELGCGPRGGLVPALTDAGYPATGVDPVAPDGPEYQQTTFEELELADPVDAIVASLSLHHVDDIDDIVERISGALTPGGVVIVVEWAWERFDEPTAEWCFGRLAPVAPGDEPRWLHRHRAGWIESGKSWPDYVNDWATGHGLHPGGSIVRALDARFDRLSLIEGPHFFVDLENITEADEQAAIDARAIRANGLRYVATRA
jgi:SAM-dependent methyltransferase